MPGLSFMGHLAGIVTGTLQVYGGLDGWAIPDESYLRGMEDWTWIRHVQRKFPTYVSTTFSSELSIPRDPSGLRRAVTASLATIRGGVSRVLGAMGVVLFGRGREANANLYLWSSTPLVRTGNSGLSILTSASSVDDDDDDEDEWVGLPPAPATESSLV